MSSKECINVCSMLVVCVAHWSCCWTGTGIIGGISPLPHPHIITHTAQTHTHTHTHTHTEFLLSHGSLVDAQSGCCQSELNLHSLACFSSWPCLPPVGFSIFYSGFLRRFPMATSDGLDGCLQRGRSQSDPNILTEPGIDLAHGTGKTHASLSGYLRAYRGKCLHL